MQKLRGVQLALFKNMAHDITWSGKKSRRNEIRSHIWRFLLYPSFWTDTNKHIGSSLKWKRLKFEDANMDKIPTRHGLYCFVVIPPTPNFIITRYLFYLGKASGSTLRTRYKQYLDEKKGNGIGAQKPRVKVEEMLNEYDGHIYFFYTEIDDSSQVIECEEKLLNTFYPYVNSLIPEGKISEEYKHIY